MSAYVMHTRLCLAVVTRLRLAGKIGHSSVMSAKRASSFAKSEAELQNLTGSMHAGTHEAEVCMYVQG